MSLSKRTLLAVGAATAIGAAIGATGLVLAQTSMAPSAFMKGEAGWSSMADAALADLGDNEAVFVAKSTFKVVRGKAKTDPATQLVKMGAREVSHGAIIIRSSGKLFIVDGTPPAGGSPQAMKDFATDLWSQSSFMKSFDNSFSPLMK